MSTEGPNKDSSPSVEQGTEGELEMQTIWIIAADYRRVRIFETQDTYNFRELEVMENSSSVKPSNGGEEVENWRNLNGQYVDSHSAIDALKGETELFPLGVGELLNEACSEHRYDKLRLLAAPEFLEEIRFALSKEAQQCIEEEIVKDISWFDAKAVKDYVRSELH